MADYSQINSDVVDGILQLYGLPISQKITPQGYGISNSNYQIQLAPNQFCLLKVSNDKNINQLLDEQKILLFLKEKKFPYSLAPYLTLAGEPVYQFKQYYGVIYPYIEGTLPEINQENLEEIGSSLATLHNIDITKSKLRSSNEVGFDLNLIQEYASTSYCPPDFKEAFNFIFTKDEMEKLSDHQPIDKLIHGDLYFDNTLFKEGKIIALLDFEQAGRGDPLLDLGICISGSCLTDNNQLAPDLIHALLQSYQGIRPLTSQEKSFIPLAINAGLFSIALWRIKRFYEGKLDQSKRDSYQELIQRSIWFRKNIEAKAFNEKI